DVRESRPAHRRRRLQPAFGRRHLHQGPRHRGGSRPRGAVPGTAGGGGAAAVRGSGRLRPWPRRRRRRRQGVCSQRWPQDTGSITILLGCIGDDFTGSSDLGNVLSKGGMRTVQYSGIPAAPADPGVEAGIVALKSRTIPPAEAVAQSLAALTWLQTQGCRQILFKYCSTFDSTPAGNIGPVAEALAEALDARHVVVCPAYPTLKRSVFHGHLFVGDRLLSESSMENHPLTPMTD